MTYEEIYSLRNSCITEEDLEKYDNEEIDLMMDSSYFIKESLSCEWGYIINLDENTLEIWKGYQTRKQLNNRYGCEKLDGFYPCKLLKKIKIKDIKKDGFDLVKILGKHYY